MQFSDVDDDGNPRPWIWYAKCRGLDPDFFFPPTNIGAINAKRLCNGNDDGVVCPVRHECLLYSIDVREWQGVWGGRVERERRKYARENGLLS